MRRLVAHVLASRAVIGGTEHGTVRMAGAVATHGYDSVAFCVAGDSPVADFVEREGMDVARFHPVEPSVTRPAQFLRSAFALAGELRRRRVDILHCADVLAAYHTAVAGQIAGVPVVCHVRSQQSHISRRDQLFLRPVRKWVFVSQDTWRHFGPSVPERRGVVVYDAIDVCSPATDAGPQVRSEFGITDEECVVCMVARISPQKDFATLISAARTVVHARPSARFLIVGDYSQDPTYRAHFEWVQQRLSDAGIADRFVFTGFRSDAKRMIAASDVCVLCTHTEGLPLVLLEGMAQSKPTIATAIGGIPEVVRHGITGLLHKHGDAGELAHHILNVLGDQALSRRLARAGHEAVAEFWNVGRFSSDVAAVYDHLLGRGRTPHGMEA